MPQPTVGVLAAILVTALLQSGGCSSQQNDAAPDVAKTPKEHSKFFTQVAGQKGPADLTNRLQDKFPEIEFTGGNTAAVDVNGWMQVEVVIAMDKSAREYSEVLEPLLTELEQYCRSLADANGAELQGTIEEELKDGTKQGFRFNYKSQAESGLVKVSVPGWRIELTVSERN